MEQSISFLPPVPYYFQHRAPIRKDSGLKWTVRDDIWSHWDAGVLDIQMSEKRILRIVNVYNQEHRQRHGWCLRNCPVGIGERVELMILGDFNAKGVLWDTKNESVREDMVMEIMDREELVLLNEPDRVTRKRGSCESVIDLAWVGENMERRCNWRILEEDVGSDHATIEIEYRQDADRVANPVNKQWNLKKADWEALELKAEQNMEVRELAWQEANEEEDIEKIARLLEEVVTESMKGSIPETRMSWRSKKWFDDEVKEKRKEVRKLRRWSKQGTEWKEKEEIEWKGKRKEFFRLIREKKKAMWDGFIGEAKSQKEMWAVWRMLNQRIYTKTPTLRDPNGIIQGFKEKEKHFREKLFPKAPIRDQQKAEPGRAKSHLRDILRQEVEQAIEGQGQKKAPGPDGVPSEVLKKMGIKFMQWITEGFNTMIRKGEHPMRWRTAIGAIIPKPNKGDYTIARSYRPISLLNTMGKALEKIVEKRITEKLEENKKEGLHEWQWGGRKGRGAEECVEWTLDWVAKKQKEGKKVMVVAMDVDQAFPNVAKVRMGNNLRKAEVEEELVEWTESFMEGRKVKLRFDGREGEWERIETGIPQGSPISPLLFNSYIAPLLRRLEKHIDARMPDDGVVPTFIDDVTMVIAGESWDEVIERGEILMKEAYEWAKENDVQFAEDKLEWIRLGRKGKEPIEEELETPNGTWKIESEIMRWLGVWLDSLLNFKEHVNIKVRKAENVTARLARLAKGEKGCGVGNLRKMYIGCARSVMDYGSRIWWKGQKSMTDKLDRADEKAMRRLGGHLRTAPGGAIRVENDLIPTALRYNERQKRIAIRTITKPADHPMRRIVEEEIQNQKEKDKGWEEKRYKKKGEGKIGGVREGIKKIDKEIKNRWKKVEESKTIKQGEKKWEKKIREGLRIVIGEGNEAGILEQRKRREGKDEVVMYTDGSKKEGKVGVGVCRVNFDGHVEWEKAFGMGSEMEIMDAEMVGIRKAIGQGIKECGKKKVYNLVVRVDSQEAMRRVKKRYEGPGEMMAYRIRWTIEAARKANITTTLEWVKSHVGVYGNEKVDRLAKQGCDKPRDTESFISLAYLMGKARQDTVQEWQKEWQTDIRKGKSYKGSPQSRKIVRFQSHERQDPVIISRLRTEHVWVNKYAKRIQKSETDQCECGKGEQSVEHVLTTCGFSIDTRNEAEGKMGKIGTLENLLYTSEGVKWAVEIWKEFVMLRRQEREEEEEADQELEWGYGVLER